VSAPEHLGPSTLTQAFNEVDPGNAPGDCVHARHGSPVPGSAAATGRSTSLAETRLRQLSMVQPSAISGRALTAFAQNVQLNKGGERAGRRKLDEFAASGGARKALSEQLLGDDHPLDLVGALVDLGDPSSWFSESRPVR